MSNIISIILLIASLGTFFGYIKPAYERVTGLPELKDRSITEILAERGRYADALNKTKEVEQARTGLLARYNAIPEKDRARLEKLLPDHIDSVRLIIDINNVASQYGMTLKNIGLTDATSDQSESTSTLGPNEEHFKAVGLQFGVVGSYEDFRSFIHDLEQSLRIVDIKTIVFNASEGGYTYAVTLSTYKLNQL